jgi:hypothetical protein
MPVEIVFSTQIGITCKSIVSKIKGSIKAILHGGFNQQFVWNYVYSGVEMNKDGLFSC